MFWRGIFICATKQIHSHVGPVAPVKFLKTFVVAYTLWYLDMYSCDTHILHLQTVFQSFCSKWGSRVTMVCCIKLGKIAICDTSGNLGLSRDIYIDSFGNPLISEMNHTVQSFMSYSTNRREKQSPLVWFSINSYKRVNLCFDFPCPIYCVAIK